jgi:predicted outer membrane repeat protein
MNAQRPSRRPSSSAHSSRRRPARPRLEALEDRVVPDGTLGLSATAYSVVKGNTATITVTRTGGATGALTVDYAVTPGTATAGLNYAGILPRPDLGDPGNKLTGTLTWADGDSAPKTFRIRALDDYQVDPALTVDIALSNLVGPGALGTSSAVLTINDFQPGRPVFSSSTYNQTTSGGSVTITVNRVGGSSGVLSAPYSTIDGTAVAGVNYTAVSGTLTWADGDSAPKTFSVPILNQSVGTTGAAFQVSLGQTGLGASRALVPSMWYNFDNHTANDGIIEDRGPNHLNLVNSQNNGAGGQPQTFFGPAPHQDNTSSGIVSHFVSSGATFPGAGTAYNLEGGTHRNYSNNNAFTGTVTGTTRDFFSWRDNMGVLPAGVTPDFSGSSSRNNNPNWYTNPIMDSRDGSISYSFWLDLPELIGSDFDPARYFGNFANREMLLGRESNDVNNPVGGVQGGGGGEFGGQVAVRTIPNYTQDPDYNPLNPMGTVKYTLELRSSGITIPTHVTFHVGEWHQFAVEYTPTATLVYEDGVLKDNIATGTYDPSKQAVGEVTGAMRLNQTAFWNTPRRESGTFNIDDLGIWQGQLSASDVQKLYGQGIGSAVADTAAVQLTDRTAPRTLTVTNLLDGAVPPAGSLRFELAAAASGDTVAFANNLAGQTVNLSAGQLELMNNVTVQGPTTGKVTINANGRSRIFEVDTGITATLRNLTLVNGFAANTATNSGYGGAVEALGNLSVSNVLFVNNTAALGGGAISTYGTLANVLTVNNAAFTSNKVLAGFGGAIGNAGATGPVTSTISVLNSSFTDNNAPSGGGAIDYVIFSSSAAGNYSLSVANDTFTGNQGANGGAIYANDSPNTGVHLTISVTNSDFSDNIAFGPVLSATLTQSGFGGAIDTFFRGSADSTSAISISDSTFSGNQGNYGAGIDTTIRLAGSSSASYTLARDAASGNNGTQGGGLYEELQNLGTGTLSVAVNSTTFDNNNVSSFSTGGATPTLVAAEGGGAFTTLSGTGTITIAYHSDTIANNSAVISGTAAGLMALGGGFYVEGTSSPTTLTLDSLTVAYNNADTDGGGVFIDPSAVTPTVGNTIVASNTSAAGAADVSGTVTSLGTNLISNTTGSGVWQPSDIQNVPAQLSDLRYNGGPARPFVERKTITLLATSPAVGAGSTSLTTDEVGNPRGAYGAPSIGALDYAATSVSQLLVLAPPVASAGTAFDVVVEAVDQYGNVVTNYAGIVYFTFTGAGSTTTPSTAPYTFTPADMGVATFVGGVTLSTPGDQVVMVIDLNDPSLTGSTVVTLS